MMNFEAIPTNMIYGLWKCAYSGVKRCNDVITYLDWATDVTDANRAYYEAQVIALRVFYYNWVWKFWGNVPYFDKNLTAPYVAEQLTADQLYEKMVTSLEEVIQLNVLPMREDSENYGISIDKTSGKLSISNYENLAEKLVDNNGALTVHAIPPL